MTAYGKETAVMKKKRPHERERTFCADSVVLHGDSGITVYGCRKILRYHPDCICLLAEKRQVRIEGEGLVCTAFSAGSVECVGRLAGVSFCKEACAQCQRGREGEET